MKSGVTGITANGSIAGWRTTDLPLELSAPPFSIIFVGAADYPIRFHPGWVILDRNGIAIASVARGIDATHLAELLNKQGRG